MTDKRKTGLARRDFLRTLGAGAGAGVAAVAAASLSTEALAAETPKEAKKSRYNPNSEDVKTYYRVNGYGY